MMIGLTIIFFIILYIYITYRITRFVASKTDKKLYWIITLLFFILLPTWDVIVGKIYFYNLCKTQGGLKVYKKIQVKGFLDTSLKAHFFQDRLWGLSQEEAKEMLNYGFKFYEVKADNGKIVHFFKDKNKSISYVLLDKPKSMYKYSCKGEKEISLLLGIKQEDVCIFTNIISDEVLMKSTWIVRDGWIGRLVEHWLGIGFGEGCGAKDTFKFKQKKILTGDFHE